MYIHIIHKRRKIYNKLISFLRIRRRRILSLTGFTLVEILLALAILGIGLVSILSLFAVGTHSARRALNLTRASLLAQLVFEEIKLLSITDYDSIVDGVEESIDIPDEYTDFGRDLSVTSEGINEVKKLELTVSWGDSSEEVFVTNVAKYSP